MSLVLRKTAVQTRGKVADDDYTRPTCQARDCPCYPSLVMEGQDWCRYHYGTQPSEWPAITQSLRDHDWFAGFMKTLGEVDRYKDWREVATKFWEEAEPYMIPRDYMTRELYLYWMHTELLYRARGCKGVRPKPPVPAGYGKPKRGPIGMGASSGPVQVSA